MGLKEIWEKTVFHRMIKDWKEEKKARKEAEHQARLEFLNSGEYKDTIKEKEKQKLKEGKGNIFKKIFGNIDFKEKFDRMSQNTDFSGKFDDMMRSDNTSKKDEDKEKKKDIDFDEKLRKYMR